VGLSFDLLINAVIAGVTVVGEAMALADALGLSEELVTGALANGPLAGIAGRAFAQGANYPLRLAAKDVTLATASADLICPELSGQRICG